MLKDKLQACFLYFGGQWDQHLTLAEFSYKNNYHSSIEMLLYEAFYGMRDRSVIGWFETYEGGPYGIYFLQYSLENISVIKDRLRASQSSRRTMQTIDSVP